MAREKQRRNSNSGPELSGEQAYEVLSAAVKALDELALERPLSPDAEWERHNCHSLLSEIDGNSGGFIRGETAPDGDCFWIAK